jgi:antitoxin VapB
MSRQLTRVFNNGNSQAVRIPQAFRIDATEVEISRDKSGDLIIHPLFPQRGDALLALLAQFTDTDFLAELEQNQREQAPMQERLPL